MAAAVFLEIELAVRNLLSCIALIGTWLLDIELAIRNLLSCTALIGTGLLDIELAIFMQRGLSTALFRTIAIRCASLLRAMFLLVLFIYKPSKGILSVTAFTQ